MVFYDSNIKRLRHVLGGHDDVLKNCFGSQLLDNEPRELSVL